MADVHITKASAAQRQIDAAIRMLFSAEDPLAIHTVVAAALGLVTDLAEQRGRPLLDESASAGLKAVSQQLLQKKLSDDDISQELPKWKKWYRRMKNRPANFLKHADHDAQGTLNPDTLQTDHLLLEASALYGDLGFDLTSEMKAFNRWHLAVYPSEDGDKFKTKAGYVHDLPRDAQIEFGNFLLALYREKQGR